MASPLAEIQQRLASQDAEAIRSVRKAGTWLGVLLQNLSAAYDPACIVLGGAGVELGDTFLGPALGTLGEYAAAANLPPPTVKTSRYGADAVAAGACALARYRLTRPLIGPGNSTATRAA
jgi:predicted NBD/HSP70 family sugar kinase